MARNKAHQGGIIIFLSLIFAIIFMLIPLPDVIRLFRPEFVLLTIIYWAMAIPQRVGIGFAWIVGLVMDLIMGGTLGVTAFAYALVIYFVLLFHLQLRQYPMWQQAMSILSLTLLVQLLFIVTSAHSASWSFWFSPAISMLLWPVIYMLLRGVRRTFHVL